MKKVGYARKKKTQKTKETQYVDADDHHVHSNEISYSGVVLVEQGGYILSGLIPHLSSCI